MAGGTSFGSTPATATQSQKDNGTASLASSSSSLSSAVGYAGPLLSAGSVSPAEDFQLVVAYCLDPARSAAELLLAEEAVRGAMHTLADVVAQLVTVGGTGAHYRKAVACLKVRAA